MGDIDELLARFDGTSTVEARRILRLECVRLVFSNGKYTTSFHIVDGANRLLKFVLTGLNDVPAQKDG